MHDKLYLQEIHIMAPSLNNWSCSNDKFIQLSLFANLSFGTITRTLTIIVLTLAIIFSNVFLIFVINSHRYGKFIHSQARYLITSLAINDFAMGTLVISLTIVPSLKLCWPFGEVTCQIQALLRVALSQQSAMILICMALDRYTFMLHFNKYKKHSSKKPSKNNNFVSLTELCDCDRHYLQISSSYSYINNGCVAIISITWILNLTVFSLIILPHGGYYFSTSGLYGCEPHYSHASIRILTACSFYFPTTMILMYCYGSAFHINQMKFIDQKFFNKVTVDTNREHDLNCIFYEKKFNANTSKTMTALSLGFILFATPWTIQEVVEACTGSKVPEIVDFFITWLLLSNSLWNPFLYWILNRHFRIVVREMLCRKAANLEKSNDDCSMVNGNLRLPVTAVQTEVAVVNGPCTDNLPDSYWSDVLELSIRNQPKTILCNHFHSNHETNDHSN